MFTLQTGVRGPNLLAFGPNGLLAVSRSEYGMTRLVEVWDLGSRELRLACEIRDRVRGLGFLPDGQHLLIGESAGIILLDILAGQREYLSMSFYFCSELTLSQGGVLLAAEQGNQYGRLACYRVEGGRLQPLWAGEAEAYVGYRAPTVSRDGRLVAALSTGCDPDSSWVTVTVREAVTGKVLSEIRGVEAERFEQLAFSPDGTRILARSKGRAVRLFDAASGEPAGELRHPGRTMVIGLAVSPVGGVIATSRNNGTAWFWDQATLTSLAYFDWKVGKLASLAFSPDGMLAAAGSSSGAVVVWDVEL
jgi:WD40 repeat protein